MELVLLALEVVEETAHAEETALAIEHQLLVLRIELNPRYIERNTGLLGVAPQVGEQGTIFRLRPRLDCALRQSFRPVRNHQIKIEVDGIAESLAARTCAVGIVEREQTRLGLFISQIAVLALEALGVTQAPGRLLLVGCDFKNHLAARAVFGFDCIYDAGPGLCRNSQTVHEHKDRLAEVQIEQGLRRGKFEHLPRLPKSVEASLAQIKQTGLELGGKCRAGARSAGG